MAELLRVKNLATQFRTESGTVKAVDGVSYDIDEQEIVGLVGESGCGKSVSQLSVMQLISPPGKIIGGEVIFEGQDLLNYRQQRPGDALHPRRQDRHDLPGAHDLAQPGADHRPAAHGDAGAAPEDERGTPPARRAIELLEHGRHPGRRATVSTTTPTSSPAACASAS